MGWTSVSVTRSIEALCGSFSLTSIDPDDDRAMSIKPAQSCSIYFDNDLILTGYIDSFSPELSGDSRSITIDGRCKTADLVDCSAVYKTGTWVGSVTLLQICSDLCAPFGIQVKSTLSDMGEKLRNFALTPGESVYEAIQRACINKAILAVSDTEGNLLLTSSGTVRSADAVMTGYNVRSASGRWEYENRFSEYTAIGQTTTEEGEGWGATQVSIIGKAVDNNFPRYRPKIIPVDGLLSVSGAKKRASWEMQVRAGKTNSVSVGLVGWRQSNESLWRENLQVYTAIPEMRVEEDLLISSLTFTQGEGGSLLSMTLNPLSTYAPEPKQEKKKKGKSETWGGW